MNSERPRQLVHLFNDSQPIDGKSHLRMYTGTESTPLLAIRKTQYAPSFTAEDHGRHLKALSQGGINIPKMHVEAGVGGTVYIATQWILSRHQTPQEKTQDSVFLRAFDIALNGLHHYAEWAKNSREAAVMHDIFSAQQFVLGPPTGSQEEAKLWLVDIDPLVTNTDAFASPVESLRSTLHLYLPKETEG